MRCLVPFACLFLLPQQSAAQPPAATEVARFIGRPVVELEVVVQDRLSNDLALRDLIEVPLNAPLAMASVRESISHLFSLGRFQDIVVEAFDAPAGVRIRFTLLPIHTVQRVEFRGRLGLDEGVLRSTMNSRFGATPGAGRAAEVARALEAVYADHGYLSASVTPNVEAGGGTARTVLAFDIDAGQQARIADVQIVGDPLQPTATFLRSVDAAPNRPYKPAEIRRGLAAWEQRMRRSRRYEAAASMRGEAAPDKASVNVVLDVQPGPIVTLVFTGSPLPKDRIEELVPVERESTVEADLIEDSERRIISYLQQQGYAKARVSTERKVEDGRLAIVFSVERGPQYRIEALELRGNSSIPAAAFAEPLERLNPGDLYVESNLDLAVSAIREVYLRRGYAQVNVDSAANEMAGTTASQGLMRPAIVVTEGPLTRVGSTSFDGNSEFSDEALAGLIGTEEGGRVSVGAPYYGPTIEQGTYKVLLEYQNAGFWSASVTPVVKVSEDGTRAHVTFTIEEGPRTFVDHVLVVGNVKTDARVIQNELLFKPGEPLGLSDLIQSQRRLSALGLFRRVTITELSHTGSMRHDVLVTVEEAPRTTLSYGGGLEASQRLRASGPEGEAEQIYEFAPRGFFDIGRRNVGGRNRTLNLYSRLGLRPDTVTDPADEGNLFGFSEYRIVATYRQPRAGWVNADLTITAAAEQGVRSSFNFSRKGVNAELLRQPSPSIRVSGRYTFGTTRTFDVQQDVLTSPLERVFPQVRVSGFSAAISRDTRDDVLDPERGSFMSAEGSIAARALGGQVGFIKSYTQGFWFKRLPGARPIVFATRATVGLADGFPRDVPAVDAEGNPLPGVTIVTEDLPASERFFAGGDTTIRGFALDTVGAPNTISPQGFPRGGNALLILSAELRVPVWGGLGIAAFVDGGNVFERVTQFDLGELRGSVGVGIRYRSPIGPLRFDVGFKLDQRPNERDRHAFHFAIGQAF